MKCSLSLYSRLENLEGEIGLLVSSACCYLAKKQAVRLVAIEKGGVVVVEVEE